MKWILLSAIVTFSFLGFSKVEDPVVATVNGKEIRKSTLLSYHKQNLNFVQSNKKVTLESSLNDLIDRMIGIDNAKKVNVHKRPEVVKKMNDIVYHAYISDKLTPLLKKIKITDKEIKAYYKKYPEYKTSQILLRLRTVPSSQEVSEAMANAQKIYNEVIQKPNNFEKFAQKYSQTATAATGGDIGYQPKVRLTPEYYEAIKGKRVGYITKPFRSQYGLTIVKVTGIKEYKQIDNNLYKKILYDEKRDAILAKYFSEERAKAKLIINKEALKND